MSTSSLVPMFSGDGQHVYVTDETGTPGSIPTANLGEALKNKYTLGVSPVHYDSLVKSGAKIGVHVTSPDGQDGILPSDQVGEAIKPENGYKLGPSFQQNIPQDYTARTELSDSELNTVRSANENRPLYRKLLGLPSNDPAAQAAEARVAPGIQSSVEGQLAEDIHAKSAPARGAATAAKGLGYELPKAVYHSFADAPRNPEEAQADSGYAGRTGLAAKRLLGDPQEAELQKGREAIAQGRTSEGIAHSVAGGLPVIGPFAAQLGEDIGQDPVAGLSEAAAYSIIPRLAKETLKTGASAVVGDAADVTAEKLRKSAATNYEKVLSPTKESTKFLTRKIMPELLDRQPVAGSRESLTNSVRDQAAQAGDAVNSAYEKIGTPKSIETKPIIDSLEKYKQQFINKIPIDHQEFGRLASGGETPVDIIDNPDGTKQYVKLVNLDPPAIERVNQLQQVIAQHGELIDPQSIRRARQLFDANVARGNGYAGKTLAEGQGLDVQREAANAIRRQLVKAHPELQAVNAEFNFWDNLRTVLDAAQLRKTGQHGGLGRKIATAAGTAVGASLGGPKGALIGAEAGSRLSKIFNSVAWQTTSAALKAKLANAISSGNHKAIGGATGAIEKALPASTKGRPLPPGGHGQEPLRQFLNQAAQQPTSTASPLEQMFSQEKPINPTGAVAARLSELKKELLDAQTPKDKADIQQAIDHLNAVATGKPFHAPEQAVVENLPASQPRDIEPGTYNRETKVHTPGKPAQSKAAAASGHGQSPVADLFAGKPQEKIDLNAPKSKRKIPPLNRNR